MPKYNLIGVGTNAKTIKGDGSEYLTAILYLAPAKIVEGINMCAMAVTAGCANACLYSAGRGHSIQYSNHVSEKQFSIETTVKNLIDYFVLILISFKSTVSKKISNLLYVLMARAIETLWISLGNTL
jgi:hypothetical protein